MWHKYCLNGADNVEDEIKELNQEWYEFQNGYRIEPRKVTRYYVQVEIDGMVDYSDEEGVGSAPGKVMLKKSFGHKSAARKWVCKMKIMSDDGFFQKMNMEEKNEYMSPDNTVEFLEKVNELGYKLFDKRIYIIREHEYNGQYIDYPAPPADAGMGAPHKEESFEV